MRTPITKWAGCVAIAAGSLASAALAQSLANVVPGDAVAYVGWRGTLDPGPAYPGSHLAAVLKDSKIDEFIDQTLPAMAVAIGKREPKARAAAAASVDVVRQAIRHPAAAFLTVVDGQPRGAIFIRAGDDSAKLAQSIKLLVDQIPPDAHAALVQQGDVIGISFNYPADAPALAEAATSLATTPTFKADLSQAAPDATFIAFANLKAGRTLLDMIVQNQAGEQFEAYTRAVDASGLSGARSAMYSAAFQGRDWQTDLLIDAPAPRTGLLALSEVKAFSPDLIKRIPADAYAMSAVRFDVAKAFGLVRTITAAADPQAADLLDKAVGGATMAIGKNIQTDLLDPLGDEWTLYTAPEIGGSTALGTVIVNKLSNAFKEKQGLASLSIFLSNTARTFLHGKGINIDVRTMQVQGTSVYYIAAPVIAPAWVVKDGFLYAGLYPQTVLEAVRYNGRSIAENEKFSQTMKSFGDKPPIAISYTDTRSTLPDGYGTALLIERTAIGLGDMYLAPTNEPFFPPLGAVLAEAAPVGSIAWGDDAGLHARSISPFPGAKGLATLSIQNVYFSNAAMMTSILLPSLNRAREAANRIKSGSNLRQIGLAAKLYANGQPRTLNLPDDFATMLATQDIGADVFISPRRGTSLPANFGAMSASEKGAWINANSDYAWLGKGLTDAAPAETILAYEKPAGLDDGINMLFADGHVDFVEMAEATKLLTAAGVTIP